MTHPCKMAIFKKKARAFFLPPDRPICAAQPKWQDASATTLSVKPRCHVVPTELGAVFYFLQAAVAAL